MTQIKRYIVQIVLCNTGIIEFQTNENNINTAMSHWLPFDEDVESIKIKRKEMSVTELLNNCIHLLIHPSGQLSRSPALTLRISDTKSYTFDLIKQDEDGYYNIIRNDKVVGGIRDDDGRIKGKINLSDISSYNTCIITQLATVDNKFLLQPMSPKQKYNPHKTNFITKEDFNDE